jgi:hypothetical protein
VIGSAVTTASAASVSGAAACRPHTVGVAGLSAAKTLATMVSNMAGGCGFTVSGFLLGVAVGIDGLQLYGSPTTFDGHGDLHLIQVNQGVVIDFYRIGSAEYARLYESDAPNAAPDVNVRGFWHAFGVSTAVINAAGSEKWVRLTPAQVKGFSKNGQIPGPFASPSALAGAVIEGTGHSWKLAGTKTVGGVACTVLTQPGSGGLYTPETLYVNTATGLPVEVQYQSQDGQAIATKFSSWGHTSTVTAPPASKVVAG